MPGSAGFPSSARVRKRAEFQRIQSGGRRVTTEHFVFVLAATPEGMRGPRLGITASRKVGVAVVRNRAKRLCRVAFRSTPELWPVGCDVVVIVRKSLGELGAAAVISEWRAVAAVLGRRARDVASAAPARHKEP
ncbi:MAG TPA: ribonuclease P protein component [Polyangiaceae bacterium]|nr:ribonuclease P protein component [Polyangiaceae bacterium]